MACKIAAAVAAVDELADVLVASFVTENPVALFGITWDDAEVDQRKSLLDD